jgi:hypothetical protein
MKIIPWVNGPSGFLSEAELPVPGDVRWTPRRKAEVVAAVNGDLLTADEAFRRYGLTAEELASWEIAFRRSGVRGLRTTRISRQRHADKLSGTASVVRQRIA